MDTLSVVVVSTIVAITLGLAVLASRRNKDAGDHYVAGQRVSALQNGLALAGEQLSAASLLGITGAVALTGFSGFYLALGIPTAFLLVLLIVAEPLRNLGKYTLADVVSHRFDGRLLRGSMAVTTLLISMIYMMIQFVGAGVLAELLLGVPFSVAVVVLAVLMTAYMLLGGMVAATYIQAFKSVLLIAVVFVLLMFVIAHTGWNPLGPITESADRFGSQIVSAHRLDATNSWNNVSLMVGLALGVMGLPHVMLRFLTTKDTRAARSSTLIAMIIFSVFFLLLPIFGYASLNEVGRQQILDDNKGGNLAIARLTEAVSGNILLAVLAGVVIATILAVLSGIAIAASGAAAHDLYANVIKRGNVSPRREVTVSRIAGLIISVLAIFLALGAQNLNVGFLANVAFAIAAATLTPVIVLTIYWRGFTRTGAQAAVTGGLLLSIVLVALGPNVMGDDAIFPLGIPAIVTVPVSFALAWLGSLAGRGRGAAQGRPYTEIAMTAFPSRATVNRRPDPPSRLDDTTP
ncbi:putative SSS family transporter [Gordonia polyisoprenivorans NBRC 16320 = JCM 10675]|uniref:Cation acetate symporter n=1 Tax=Gordonia polyisoprenivorans TaxID=84595 RepID=A0A846WMS4_9ACTN|nr:cation acetate symporter [Gordonia polyisoprenivorans]NKY02898.1 cation acetate symporter [Gordonia polyisoprenivorans]WCB37240.1 cation acetate symporter [Gordonia polyisoprenivorans]GAB24983.1 putative SSS family transporter [Gordonia polyisoprenivorans NBRC 16320 = JCM 10675]